MKPQVKQSEKSRILSTKDYSIFEFPDFKVSKKHLERIKDSIKLKNLSRDYPVLVDDKYRVIEGRYRFLACFDLKLELFYKIAEVTELRDAIRIKHIHKNIDVEEVVKVYADLEPYNNILLMFEEFNGKFSMRYICQHINQATHGFASSGPMLDRKVFDAGNLGKWNYVKVKNRLNEVVQFVREYRKYGWNEIHFFRIGSPYSLNQEDRDWCLKHAEKYRKQVENHIQKRNPDFRCDILSAFNTLASYRSGFDKDDDPYGVYYNGWPAKRRQSVIPK